MQPKKSDLETGGGGGVLPTKAKVQIIKNFYVYIPDGGGGRVDRFGPFFCIISYLSVLFSTTKTKKKLTEGAAIPPSLISAPVHR